MSRSCMFDYVLTIFYASFWEMKVPALNAHTMRKLSTQQNGRVDDEIIVQFLNAIATLITR